MGQIYRDADEVVAWLHPPAILEIAEELTANPQALRDSEEVLSAASRLEKMLNVSCRSTSEIQRSAVIVSLLFNTE